VELPLQASKSCLGLIVRLYDTQHNNINITLRLMTLSIITEWHVCLIVMLTVIMLSVIILSVIVLNVIMLSVVMLSVVMLCFVTLNIIMLNVIMLSVLSSIDGVKLSSQNAAARLAK
jgi:hypothetical protein